MAQSSIVLRAECPRSCWQDANSTLPQNKLSFSVKFDGNMITTVIFDMDDTLYDEVDYCSSGFRAFGRFLGEKHGVDSEKAYELLWSEFCSGNHGRTFNVALEGLGVPYETANILALVKVSRNQKPKIHKPFHSKDLSSILNCFSPV
jgi:hypothetical protein